MRSFAAVAAFATLAFSTLASAIPVLPAAPAAPVPLPPLPGAASLPKVRGLLEGSVSGSNLGATASKRNIVVAGLDLTGLAGNPDASVKSRGVAYQSIPDVLVALNDKVVPLCHDLQGKVEAAVSADIALALSLDVLGQVKDLVFVAKADIEALVAANVAGILNLKGQVISVTAIAQILATLVIAIETVVGVIVKICAAIEIKALIALVIEISGCLAGIIAIVLKLSAGVLVELQGLVKVVVDVILSLHLEALIQVLHLTVQA